MLTLEHEKLLWDKKELDLDTSKGLLQAVIFYLIKCFAVWQGKELRQLQTSQITFGENKLGKFVALDLQSSGFKRKGSVKRYDDPANPRSVYKIFKKYQSRIANEGPFLVRPIYAIKDFVCFSPLPLGMRHVKTFISTIMEEARIGRCFVNYSLNLQSIDTLMRFGMGKHCLSSWQMTNSVKETTQFPECNSANCEDINPEVSVMISRLLDAPYPFDAVEIIQKMESEEQKRAKQNALDTVNFDSWMTNIIGTTKNGVAIENPESECPTSVDLDTKETVKELLISHELSSSNTHVISANVKETDSEEKRLKSSEVSNSKSETPGPQIMAISSISEDAFSVQEDEGDSLGRCMLTDRPTEDKSHSIGENKNKSLPRKKRKISSELEEQSEETSAKVSKQGDTVEASAIASSKETCRPHVKGEVYDESIDNATVNILNNSTRPRHEEIKKEVSDHTMQNTENAISEDIGTTSEDYPSLPQISHEKCSDKVQKGNLPKASKANTSSHVLGLQNPDSSRDSITILRRLLLSGGTEDDKIPCEKNSAVNYIGNDSYQANTQVKRLLKAKLGSEKSGQFSECETECENIEDDEQIIMDLSPPTLSPQAPTSGHVTMDDAVLSKCVVLTDDFTSSSSSDQSAPSLLPMPESSDIVQFLDKAHLQIKNILNTATKDDCPKSMKGDESTKVNASRQKGNKGTTFKHSRKSKRPMKITNTASSRESSPSKAMQQVETEIAANSKPTNLSDQSQSHFPLLRSFLEQPIGETEVVMASRSATNTTTTTTTTNTNTPAKVDHKPKKENLSASSKLSMLAQVLTDTRSKPPKLTFMGSASSVPKACNGGQDGNFNYEPTHSKPSDLRKENNNWEIESTILADDNGECVDSVSISSSATPASPSTPPTISNIEKPNNAVYKAEKDFVNNVVYQTLKVNNEEDGVRTFTFADIPNASSAVSKSKRFQGSRQTSEINLGDYFPPGTLIPAKNIHLVTQQGPQGCDIVMKFSFNQKD